MSFDNFLKSLETDGGKVLIIIGLLVFIVITVMIFLLTGHQLQEMGNGDDHRGGVVAVGDSLWLSQGRRGKVKHAIPASYEGGIYYRNPDEVLRRAHNYLVMRTGHPIDPDDREACNLLYRLHVEYFLEELTR